MPLVRLRLLGNEVRVFTSEEQFSADVSSRNKVWSFLYRKLIAIPLWLFRPRAPLTTVSSAGKPVINYKDKSDVSVWADAPQDAKDLAKRTSELGWYHTFNLGHGIVTPGVFDHAPIVDRYQLPESLKGQRVLDVACFDGFWAFEFERRGAEEVVALDVNNASELDFPFGVRSQMTSEELARQMGQGFKIVHDATGSKVRRVHCNVYDLNPEVAGKFDVVHIGDVLLHLQNPAKALDRVRQVTRGYALISDFYDPRLDRMGRYPLMEYCGGQSDCVWWHFSLGGLEKMIHDAGFTKVELITKFRYGMRGQRQQMWHAVFKAYV